MPLLLLNFKEKNRCRRPCPWLTDELVHLVRKRNSLHKQLTKHPTDAHLRHQHKCARREARRLDRRLRNQYFLNKCESSPPHKLWSVMNTVTCRNKSHREPQVSAGELSKTFGEIVTDKKRPADLLSPLGPQKPYSFYEFQPCTPGQVLNLLKAIDTSKATGSDRVPGLVLKMAP